MKYVALLRGINVGGKNSVKMSDLANIFTAIGFTQVRTYINSGNVLFETKISSNTKITQSIENVLLKQLKIQLRVVIVSKKQLKAVIAGIPKAWKSDNVRKYIAFVFPTSTPKQVIKEATLKVGIDEIEEGPGVVYMTTKLAGLTKSGLNKIAQTRIYKDITIRNFTTVKKLGELLLQ